MKKIHTLFALFLSIVFIECKKVPGTPDFHFTFNIGSQTYSLDSAVFNFYNNGDTASSFTIQAFSWTYRYRINAFGQNPFDTNFVGTYLTIASRDPIKLLTAGGFICSNYNDVNYGTYPIRYDGKFSFTIDKKTATFVAGTFGGTLTSDLLKTINISNGKFTIPYKR